MSETVDDRVLTTGANGFIGRALADHYRAAGVEVRGAYLEADSQLGILWLPRADAGPGQAWRKGYGVTPSGYRYRALSPNNKLSSPFIKLRDD